VLSKASFARPENKNAPSGGFVLTAGCRGQGSNFYAKDLLKITDFIL